MDNTLYKHSKEVRKELLELNRKIAIANSNSSKVTTVIQSSGIGGSSSITATNIGGYAQEITNTSNVDLGSIEAKYIFEELKCIVTIPAPAGTTFQVIDQNKNIIIPIGMITPDKNGSWTWNGNLRTTGLITLTGIFSNSDANIEIIFIKKVWKII